MRWTSSFFADLFLPRFVILLHFCNSIKKDIFFLIKLNLHILSISLPFDICTFRLFIFSLLMFTDIKQQISFLILSRNLGKEWDFFLIIIYIFKSENIDFK